MGLFSGQNKALVKPKTYINENGYYCFTNSDYPAHRWVAQKKIGWKLRKGEVDHPINHNKRDNSEENIYICSSQREHEKTHRLDRIFGKGIGIELINKRTYFAIEIIPLIIRVLIIVIVVYIILEILGIV